MANQKKFFTPHYNLFNNFLQYLFIKKVLKARIFEAYS